MPIDFRRILFLIIAILCVFPNNSVHAMETQAYDKLDLRIAKAILVMEEFMKSPDKETVTSLIRGSAAVAVFPSVYKGAFFAGGQYGKGVMCSFDQKTGKWGAPAFFSVGGGSFGYQFGAQATDLVLVIANPRGVQSLLKSSVTLGGDVSIAAGPVGRKAQAETDGTLSAEIYSYSRTKGLFAGIALKGAVISPEKDSNQLYYGKGCTPEEILIHHKTRPRDSGIELVELLNQLGN